MTQLAPADYAVVADNMSYVPEAKITNSRLINALENESKSRLGQLFG
ncbi:MAG: hypothetical protein LBT38_03915 [Deltaproteobacteria bacterium]|nr:hypothetical protein [Deltaproteobacteria bacterium]